MFEHTSPLQGLNTIACQQRALGCQPAGGQWAWGERRVLYKEGHKEVI